MSGYRSREWIRYTLAFLVLAAAGASVRAEECPGVDAAALQWLDKMSRSLHDIDYEGVVTLERGDETRVVNIQHSVHDATESLKLSHLTGNGGDVVREGQPLACVHPGHAMLRSDAQEPCGVGRFYQLTVGAEQRVAGRRTIVLGAAPRDMYRYGYRLALDAETGLLLKVETLGKGGSPLESFQFASVTMNTRPAGTGSANAAATQACSAPSDVASATVPWQVRWLPAGFAAAAGPEQGGQTFTDGFASFSIYLTKPASPLQPGEGVVRKGSTLTYVRGMQLGGGPVLATLVGEIPLNTARMVVDQIAWSR